LIEVPVPDLQSLPQCLHDGETVTVVSYNGTYEYIESRAGRIETPSNPDIRMQPDFGVAALLPAFFAAVAGLTWALARIRLKRDGFDDGLSLGDESAASFRQWWRECGVSSWADAQALLQSTDYPLDRDAVKVLHTMLRRNGVIDD
jgi:hypothetical protein